MIFNADHKLPTFDISGLSILSVHLLRAHLIHLQGVIELREPKDIPYLCNMSHKISRADFVGRIDAALHIDLGHYPNVAEGLSTGKFHTLQNTVNNLIDNQGLHAWVMIRQILDSEMTAAGKADFIHVLDTYQPRETVFDRLCNTFNMDTPKSLRYKIVAQLRLRWIREILATLPETK